MIDIVQGAYWYTSGKKIFEQVDIHIGAGEIIGILGKNGEGKTTLLKCINGILPLRQGEVLIGGKAIRYLTPKDIARIIAYVPQYQNVGGDGTVFDTIMMGRIPFVDRKYTQTDRNKVFSLIEEFHLEDLAFRSMKSLSGGQRQMVMIVRAIAQEPKAILLDEPTNNLDIHNQVYILTELKRLAKENGITIITTLHDLNAISLFCERCLAIKNGHVECFSTIDKLLDEKILEQIYGLPIRVVEDQGQKYIHWSLAS